MKKLRIAVFFVVLLGIVPVSVVAEDSYRTAGALHESELGSLAASKHGLGGRIFDVSRTELGDGVAHYQFKLRVGDGAFDVVRVHRVVRERRPHRPVRTKAAVFMVPGALLDFDSIFLTAGADDVNADTSVALFLATKKIDVWGIDLGWTLVPEETVDFSFMQGWGIQRDVDHTRDAMAVARVFRWLSGQGFGRIHLLGFSYGVHVAYAAAGQETQQPRRRRHISGIIPVEAVFKYAPEDEMFKQFTCASAAGVQGLLDAGVFQNSDAIFLAQLGALAMQAPDDMSPAIPGFTNFQAALFTGVANPPTAPLFHFFGAEFNEAGIPIGYLYSDPARWISMMTSLPPYQPFQGFYDFFATNCDEEDVSFDDHLADIELPILYLGAGGGTGTLGQFTSSLTASRDITNITISLQEPENRLIDFGHVDLFVGDEAKDLAWQPLRKWLVDHGSRTYHRK